MYGIFRENQKNSQTIVRQRQVQLIFGKNYKNLIMTETATQR